MVTLNAIFMRIFLGKVLYVIIGTEIPFMICSKLRMLFINAYLLLLSIYKVIYIIINSKRRVKKEAGFNLFALLCIHYCGVIYKLK